MYKKERRREKFVIIEFKKVIVRVWRYNKIGCVDIDETTQKMLYVDNFLIDSMNEMQRKAYAYFETLNIQNIVNNIDSTNAVEIE